MPNSRMIYKAGKLSFLLVCLFLCTACGREKAVFETKEIITEVSLEEEETEKEKREGGRVRKRKGETCVS